MCLQVINFIDFILDVNTSYQDEIEHFWTFRNYCCKMEIVQMEQCCNAFN